MSKLFKKYEQDRIPDGQFGFNGVALSLEAIRELHGGKIRKGVSDAIDTRYAVKK